uniref:RING-type domain-containing protein n=1 Tax=Panagrolaimus superbus TaxID=310955 RepID=A0A914Z267_9BILA
MSNETTASLKTYNLLSQTRVDHAGLPMNGNITDCFICCQPSDVFGVGKCFHPICMECCIVMRVLDISNTCPQCRFPIEMLYFVSAPYSWDNFTFPSGEVHHPDSKKYGLKFTSDYTVKCYDSYVKHSCSICAKINSEKVYPTFAALKNHMTNVHQRNFCSICDQHLQSLSKNRVAFTKTEMENHLKGTNNEASGQKGHPMCWICSGRFFDDDFLNRHLKSEHFFCQLCEDFGSIVSFGTTPELYAHYALEHFPCDSRDCQHMGIVFSTEEELELHKADEHGFSLRNLTALFTGRSNQSTPRDVLSTPQRESQPLASEVQPSSAARNASIQSIRTSLLNIARTRPSASSQVSNNPSIHTAILNLSQREAHHSPRPPTIVRHAPSNQSVQTAVLNLSQRESQPSSSSRHPPTIRNAPSNQSVHTAVFNASQREAQPFSFQPTPIVRNVPSNQSVQAAIPSNSQISSTSRTSTPQTRASEISIASSRTVTASPARNMRTPPLQLVQSSPQRSTSSNDRLMPSTYVSSVQRQRRQVFVCCIAAVFLVIIFLLIIKAMAKKN